MLRDVRSKMRGDTYLNFDFFTSTCQNFSPFSIPYQAGSSKIARRVTFDCVPSMPLSLSRECLFGDKLLMPSIRKVSEWCWWCSPLRLDSLCSNAKKGWGWGRICLFSAVLLAVALDSRWEIEFLRHRSEFGAHHIDQEWYEGIFNLLSVPGHVYSILWKKTIIHTRIWGESLCNFSPASLLLC